MKTILIMKHCNFIYKLSQVIRKLLNFKFGISIVQIMNRLSTTTAVEMHSASTPQIRIVQVIVALYFLNRNRV